MDHRTKALFSDREMFHILPKLQAKRADFLTLMLTGSLHQYRGFMATPLDTQDDGLWEDNVKKSESDSLDQSQDGPPSTLLAMDPQKEAREPGSVADVDMDQEDISKTLVLFSPGDVRKSLSEKEAVELQTCLPEKNQQPSTKACDGGTVRLFQQKCDPALCAASPTPVTNLQKHQPAQEPAQNQNQQNDGRTYRMTELRVKRESNRQPSSTHPPLIKEQLNLSKEQCLDADDPGISSVVRRKSNPSAITLVPSASAASPPFTKVERTFLHIAETTHLNIMSSRVPQGQGAGRELSEKLQCEVEPQPKSIVLKVEGVRSKHPSHTPSELQGFNVVDGRVKSQTPAKMGITVCPVYMWTHRHILAKPLPEKPKNQLQNWAGQNQPGDYSTSSPLKGRSRIPVLVSEDSAAADPSPSPDPTPKPPQRTHVTRLLLERRRRALNFRTSSSLSSEDEPRRVSETPSTNEEETHQSDDSMGKVKQEVSGWNSRIPRPVTPVDRAPAKLLLAISTTSAVRPDNFTHTANTGLRCLQSGAGVRSKSALSRPASPHTPLRCVLTTSRSLHSTHRTHSPSPQRSIIRTTRSHTHHVTHNVTHSHRTKALLSVKHTTKVRQKHNTATDT